MNLHAGRMVFGGPLESTEIVHAVCVCCLGASVRRVPRGKTIISNSPTLRTDSSPAASELCLQTRSVAIVYTSEEKEMKTRLYEVVQTVCDKIRDEAGLRRLVVKRNDHATYLDDDEEEEEDFFAEGSKKIVAVNNREKAGLTAEERLRAREEPSGGAASGVFGWLKLW